MDLKLRKRLGLALFLAGLVFLGIFLRAQLNYSAAKRSYQTLRETVAEIKTEEPGPGGSRVNFDVLREINPEVVGWLEIPALELALPVVQGEDDQTYLHTGFDGKPSNDGCLLVSAADDPAGAYHVVYGHNMANGNMFGRLNKFREKDFALENSRFQLYTPTGDYTCRIFACREDVDSSETYRVDWKIDSAAYGAFLAGLKQTALFAMDTVPDQQAQVITLSTCASPYTSGLQRFTVHAVMEPMA